MTRAQQAAWDIYVARVVEQYTAYGEGRPVTRLVMLPIEKSHVEAIERAMGDARKEGAKAALDITYHNGLSERL